MDSYSSSSQEDIDQQIDNIEQQNKITKKPRIMPKKGNYRMHAHINPFNETLFPFPLNPDFVNWSIHYPLYFQGNAEDNLKMFANTINHPIIYDQKADPKFNGLLGRHPDFLDIGCGYGGLLFSLTKNFPDKLSFGLEIRGKVVDYVVEKIHALRIEHQCNNIAVIRTNTMRHFCQYFRKASIEKIFICFPDPHFKQRNHRRRIVNLGFLSEYAFAMKSKGRIYCITDVEDLHNWHVDHIQRHNQFRVLSEEEYKDDICPKIIQCETEESKKVDKKQGKKYFIVAERI